MRITEIVLGADHPGLEVAEETLKAMTSALLLIGQGAMVELTENARMSPAQATMLTNQMFAHFAQNAVKSISN